MSLIYILFYAVRVMKTEKNSSRIKENKAEFHIKKMFVSKSSSVP